MDARYRLYAAATGTAALFLAVQVGALALVEPFGSAGYQAVEDPSDPTNSVVYLGAILVMTGVMLAVIRYGMAGILRVVVTAMAGLLSLYVFSVLVPPAVRVGGYNALAVALAALLAVALYVHPEWYVIDAAGVIIGASGAGLFGISFGPLPAVVLLLALAVYDAISVYRTEHMLTLAESVTDLNLPLVLVVPLSLSYSFREGEAVAAAGDSDGNDEDEEAPEGLDREAFFVGLGDTVMPSILVASAAFFSSAPSLGVAGFPLNLPALAAMLGTMAGVGALLWLVAKGRAHAGLPLLNGGAIAGYLLGASAAGIPLVEALGLAPYL